MRFEVLGRSADRELIRSLARQISDALATRYQHLLDTNIISQATKPSLWARLMAAGTAADQPRSALDTIIAAVAEANGCTVVTDNQKNFPDVRVFNPLHSED